jgi:hypothetical protein
LSFPLPIHDWQFWVVTLIALFALWFVLRRALPARLGGRKSKGVKTTLTIAGKAPDAPR